MNNMQAQLKTFSSSKINPTRTKRKFYCWSSRNIYTHGNKTWLENKAGHTEDAYHKKLMGGGEEGWEWRLGVIFNNVKISNHKISLINCIGSLPNYSGKNTLAIVDSGANMHLAKQATTTMFPVIISNGTTSRLSHGRTLQSLHTATIQIPGQIKQASQIQISPRMKTAPLISLGILFYDVNTITLD